MARGGGFAHTADANQAGSVGAGAAEMTAIQAGEIILLAGVGLLMMGVATPLIRRRIGPNHAYGLRIPATFADREVWFEANAKSGRDFFVLGIVQLILGLGLAGVPVRWQKVYIIADVVILIAGAVLCLIVGSRRAERLLARRS
jgi:uncharacterized membrane protein